jgi:hypothetical protein
MSQDNTEHYETSYSEYAQETNENAPQPPEPDNQDPTKPTKAETTYSKAASEQKDTDQPGSS